MQAIPERLRAAVAAGAEGLKAERRGLLSAAEAKDDVNRLRRRHFEHLCVEARMDLGPDLCTYVCWRQPGDWSEAGDLHRFYLQVPGLSMVAAEYKLYNGVWRLWRWGVTTYETDRGYTRKAWAVYPHTRPAAEVLALAREQYQIFRATPKVSEVVISEI